MESTVQICGVDYPSCELIQRGTFSGIQTPEKTFWLFPVCDDGGREIKSLPPYLPHAIRAVTVEPPDLTQRYPETVKELFDKRRSYFATATLQKYKSQYRDAFLLTEERFQEERNRILSEPSEDFARDPRARQLVWERHGTVELANEVGYLGDVFETETLKDGTKRRFSREASVETSLIIGLRAKRELDWDQARGIVDKLKFVMIYKDVPEQQFIYLEGMKIAAASPQGTPRVPQLRIGVKIESQSHSRISLHWPDGETYLKEIKAASQQTLALVTKLHGKKLAKDKKWHQEGGRATSKWKGREREAAELARHMRQVRDSWIQTNGTKRGANKKAIESGRAWWKTKFKGAPLEGFLDDQKVSDANLFRLMRRDFRKTPKSNT